MDGQDETPESGRCPVTGGAAVFYGEKNGHRLWRSADTEIIFVDPLPTETELSDYYNSNYFERDPARYLQASRSADSTWRRRIDTLRRLAGYGSLADWTALDIGAGTGAFLSRLAEHCNRLHAVEFSQEGRKQLIKIPVLVQPVPARLETASYQEEAFDLITMWAVLEHLPYDPDFFSRLRRMMKTGGIIALSVPNVQAWNRRWFSLAWRYFTPPEHLVFYGLPTLRTQLEKSGFRIVMHQSFFSQQAFREGMSNSRIPRILRLPLIGVGSAIGPAASILGAGDTLEIYAVAE